MRLRTEARRFSDDRGVSMVMAIVATGVMLTIGATVTIRAVSDQRQVSRERIYERALHVADSGLDATLHALTQDATFETGEVLPASFATRTAEEQWAIAEAADNPSVQVAGGEYAIVKPELADGSTAFVIYSVGYVPSRAAATRVRVVRSEYDFAPFVPGVALLSGGPMDLSGNPSLTGDAGSAHANGDVIISGSPTTAGYVTAGGTYTISGSPTIGDVAHSGGGKPTVDVPNIDPRDYYSKSQYDLCPDGAVRTGPAYGGPEAANPSLTPCLGTLLADASSSEFRGWRRTGSDGSSGATWGYGSNTNYDGIYYVYQGSIRITGSPGSVTDPWEVTLLTEASSGGGPEPDCPHTGGDIYIGGSPSMRYAPTAQPLLLYAGRDIDIAGNLAGGALAYEGVIAAHEQFEVSGNPTVSGVFIGEDGCNTTGSPVTKSDVSGNPSVSYNGDLEFPTGDRIRSTLWLEL